MLEVTFSTVLWSDEAPWRSSSLFYYVNITKSPSKKGHQLNKEAKNRHG